MSMRISNLPVLAVAAMLAACSNGASEQTADPASQIACALAGAEEFTRDCTVEQIEREGKLSLVVRHPDGGFRRFDVLTDGRGVAVADGADVAETALDGSTLEVVVGTDAYRFPVTRKPGTQGNAPTK